MQNILTQFNVKKYIHRGNEREETVCKFCQKKFNITKLYNHYNSKIKIINCPYCQVTYSAGENFNFKTLNKMGERLPDNYKQEVIDKNIWYSYTNELYE